MRTIFSFKYDLSYQFIDCLVPDDFKKFSVHVISLGITNVKESNSVLMV